jgi:ribosomal-protein-alanine N-acetyltransferase
LKPTREHIILELRTERLRLRPSIAGDLDILWSQWTTPEVRHFLWDGRAISREEAAAYIDRSSTSFAEYGFGLWVVCVGETEEVVGFCACGLEEGVPKLVYGFAPAYWGRGFATEAASAVLDYCFTTLGIEQIATTVDVPNTASQRVLERLGMRCQGEKTVNGLPVIAYHLTAEEFRAGWEAMGAPHEE